MVPKRRNKWNLTKLPNLIHASQIHDYTSISPVVFTTINEPLKYVFL